MMTATQQRAVGAIGLALDAALLWNARRLYKKGRGGWGTFFLIWGGSGLAWNAYQLATASEKPMVARYAGSKVWSSSPTRYLPGGGINEAGMVFGPDNPSGLPIVGLRF